jgi:hypothetical protein
MQSESCLGVYCTRGKQNKGSDAASVSPPPPATGCRQRLPCRRRAQLWGGAFPQPARRPHGYILGRGTAACGSIIILRESELYLPGEKFGSGNLPKIIFVLLIFAIARAVEGLLVQERQQTLPVGASPGRTWAHSENPASADPHRRTALSRGFGQIVWALPKLIVARS